MMFEYIEKLLIEIYYFIWSIKYKIEKWVRRDGKRN